MAFCSIILQQFLTGECLFLFFRDLKNHLQYGFSTYLYVWQSFCLLSFVCISSGQMPVRGRDKMYQRRMYEG